MNIKAFHQGKQQGRSLATSLYFGKAVFNTPSTNPTQGPHRAETLPNLKTNVGQSLEGQGGAAGQGVRE